MRESFGDSKIRVMILTHLYRTLLVLIQWHIKCRVQRWRPPKMLARNSSCKPLQEPVNQLIQVEWKGEISLSRGGQLSRVICQYSSEVYRIVIEIRRWLVRSSSHFYNRVNRQDSNGCQISWSSRVREWNLKQTTRNVRKITFRANTIRRFLYIAGKDGNEA